MKIKPCPFCGNADLRICKELSVNGKVIVGYHVVCEPDKPCGAQGPITNTKRTAQAEWNKRVKL